MRFTLESSFENRSFHFFIYHLIWRVQERTKLLAILVLYLVLVMQIYHQNKGLQK